MKKLRIIALMMLCVLVAISLVACDFGHIKDTNGDEDFTLETITDEDILAGGTKYVAFGSQNLTVGDVHSVTVKKFSGVWQVAMLELQGGSAAVTMDMTVAKGNCRVVLICNDEIVHDFDINGQDTYTVHTAGKYYIKLAGESAEISKMDFTWSLV